MVCLYSYLLCKEVMFYFISFVFIYIYWCFNTISISDDVRVTWQVLLVEQELLALPDHLSSFMVLVGFISISIVFYIVFCAPLFVFSSFSFLPLYFPFFYDLQLLSEKYRISKSQVVSLTHPRFKTLYIHEKIHWRNRLQ